MDTGTYISLGLLLPIIGMAIGMVQQRIKSSNSRTIIETKLENKVEYLDDRILELKVDYKERIAEMQVIHESSLNTIRNDVARLSDSIEKLDKTICELSSTLINIYKQLDIHIAIDKERNKV